MTTNMRFVTIEIFRLENRCKFDYQNNINVIIMIVSNNHLPMLKIILLCQRVLTSPYVGVLVSLLLILPSLYIILGDITVFRKEYVFLAVGIPLYVKSLNKIFNNILNSDNK